ncbi:MAG: ABC transporter permease [Promethearchaeota archaeon]
MIGFLLGYLLNVLIPEQLLPSTQAEYLQENLGFIVFIIIFGASFFFGGIICKEYSEKTGYIVFPKINRYKLFTGKLLGNLTYFLMVITVYYFITIIFGIFFYGFPIINRMWLSLGFALLYSLMVASFVTFLSSFMKSVSMTIVFCVLFLLIGFSIIDQFVVLFNPDFEPLYSFDFLSKIIQYSLRSDFPTKLEDRYEDMDFRDFVFRAWLTPTKEMALIMMISYTCFFLAFAILIFTRKQL